MGDDPVASIEAYVMASDAPAICLLDRARFRALLVRYRALEAENVRLRARVRETVWVDAGSFW